MTGTTGSARHGDRSGGRSPGASSRTAAVAVLDDLYDRGHLADIDCHFAGLIAELDGGAGPELPLAAALASAWTRDGHACIALAEVAGREWPRAGAVRLPALDRWIDALDASPIVARPKDAERRPLVLDRQGRLYLERLWTAEQAVAASLHGLAGGAESGPGENIGVAGRSGYSEHGAQRPASDPDVEPDRLEAALDRFFPGTASGDPIRMAARTAICRRLCVISGGPGTGKTTIAAAIVALLIELGLAAPGAIALAAPTGKAAARLQEAVRGRHRAMTSLVPALEGYEAQATTVHRWLLRRGRSDQGGPPVDALILDEGSMVDLTLMARVLSALPDGARFVVLGDASQLASVQPGAVFADLCRAGTDVEAGIGAGRAGADCTPVRASSSLAPCVVELVRNWRFDEAGGIGRLAAAVVRGDAPAVVAALRDPSDDATELRALPDADRFERLATKFAEERFAVALRAMRALREPGGGVRSLASFRVLCAHRVGLFGADRFNRSVERRLRALGLVRENDTFYPGRPILITRNDPRTGLANGDTGVVLRDAADRIQVWFPELDGSDGQPRLVAPARLPPHESFFAVTVHRAQGSEYDEVAVVLGPADSRVATRELLYTAVTRARRRVVVYGSDESVRAAVERVTERSSGLRDALAGGAGMDGSM